MPSIRFQLDAPLARVEAHVRATYGSDARVVSAITSPAKAYAVPLVHRLNLGRCSSPALGSTDRAAPYVLAAGETRRDDAILPFKALASDTGGLLSVCEFTLGGWETGPVLHRHDAVDEAFYVVAGRLEAQLDDQRVQVAAGGFLWVPRGTAHTFANAGPDSAPDA